jgi:hypothetical protein
MNPVPHNVYKEKVERFNAMDPLHFSDNRCLWLACTIGEECQDFNGTEYAFHSSAAVQTR